jgi:hypothetical protein
VLEYTVTVPQRAATVITPSPSIQVTVSRPGSQGPQGIQGIQGLPGDGVPVVGEQPTGTKDGVNTVFTTASVFRAGTTAVYLNGLREFYYAETGASEITLEDAPESSDSLRIDYVI